jgi:hypothetical protein
MAEEQYDVEAAAGGESVLNGYAEETAPAPVHAAASAADSEDDEERRREKRRERFALESAAVQDAEPAKGKGARRERRERPAKSMRDAAAKGPPPEIEGSEVIGRFRRCFRCGKRFGAHDVRSFQCHKCGDRPAPRADDAGDAVGGRETDAAADHGEGGAEEGEGVEEGRKRRRGEREREAPSKGPMHMEGSTIVEV